MLVLSSTVYKDCARAGRLGNQLFVWASLLSLASLLPGDVRFQSLSEAPAGCSEWLWYLNDSVPLSTTFAAAGNHCASWETYEAASVHYDEAIPQLFMDPQLPASRTTPCVLPAAPAPPNKTAPPTSRCRRHRI